MYDEVKQFISEIENDKRLVKPGEHLTISYDGSKLSSRINEKIVRTLDDVDPLFANDVKLFIMFDPEFTITTFRVSNSAFDARYMRKKSRKR